MKLESGDLFERECAAWLRDNLPWYETVWSKFIGHDGRGMLLPMFGLGEAADRERKKFAQAHYTFALNLYLLTNIEKRVSVGTYRLGNFADYMQAVEQFTLFIALVGQVRDMAVDMAETLNDDSIRSPFDPIFGMRSNALHAARIPLQIDSHGVRIPALSRRVKKEGEWNDHQNWDEVSADGFVYLADYCRDTVAEILKLSKQVHGTIMSRAHEKFPGNLMEPSAEAGETAIQTIALSNGSGCTDGVAPTVPPGWRFPVQPTPCFSSTRLPRLPSPSGASIISTIEPTPS